MLVICGIWSAPMESVRGYPVDQRGDRCTSAPPIRSVFRYFGPWTLWHGAARNDALPARENRTESELARHRLMRITAAKNGPFDYHGMTKSAR